LPTKAENMNYLIIYPFTIKKEIVITKTKAVWYIGNESCACKSKLKPNIFRLL